MSSLRIARIELDNWLNFRRVDIPVRERLFIVGPNAAGKSNFLAALRFLRDLVADGGGLQEAVRSRGGLSVIRCLAARARSDVGIAVEVIDDGERPALWRYELEIKQDNQRRPFVAKERVQRDGEVLLSRPDDHDEADSDLRAQTAIEQVTSNRAFRALADFFGDIQYLHLVPQIVRDPDRVGGRRHDPFGADLLYEIARTQKKTRDAWLRRINAALKVVVPQLAELELQTDVMGVPHLHGRYEHWRPNAGWQTEAQFSDGTLRLVGLLWATLAGRGPLLLEEPELSLHPAIVRELPRMLSRMQTRSGRQVFLSTHSPALISDEGIGLDELLVLVPTPNGTDAQLAHDIADVRELLEAGVPLSEIMEARTRPDQAQQLSLFADA